MSSPAIGTTARDAKIRAMRGIAAPVKEHAGLRTTRQAETVRTAIVLVLSATMRTE
jgi:hypothetical protein